jgi:hypothetical protein
MSVNKEEKDIRLSSVEAFDKMLYGALQVHSEPVPTDFTDRVSRLIKEAEERKILARVVMEERFALAGCIVLGIITVVSMGLFPSIVLNFKELVEAFVRKAAQSVEIVYYGWYLYAVFAAMIGFVVYNLMDLLVGDARR